MDIIYFIFYFNLFLGSSDFILDPAEFAINTAIIIIIFIITYNICITNVYY